MIACPLQRSSRPHLIYPNSRREPITSPWAEAGLTEPPATSLLRPLLNRLGKNVPRFVEIIARIKQAIDLHAVARPISRLCSAQSAFQTQSVNSRSPVDVAADWEISSGNPARPCSFIWASRGLHMDRSDQYRRFAKECLELARTALTERSKATLLHMAHVWNRLADEHAREADSDEAP